MLATIILDCAVPASLADFYRTLTGWQVTYGDDDFVYLGDGGPIQLAFQRVDGYLPAAWPGPAKQAHLDFKVTDVQQTVEQLVKLGAAVPDFQPGNGEWIVLTDPEGHPLCVAATE